MTFSFTREITFNFMFVFLHTKSLLKAVFSERKEFASKGSKFFSFFFFFFFFFFFRIDSLKGGSKIILIELLTLKVYQFRVSLSFSSG